jgi:imidazolonepropionase-like amidohydrolase
MTARPCCLLVLAGAFLGTAVPAAPAPASVLALVGGDVHTVSNGTLEGATVLIENGKVTAVGTDVAVPPGAERVDVSGRHVYPGLIAAHTWLGLSEIESVRGTQDVRESGNINPNARAVVALNADSELIPVARANGILTVLTATAGGALSGRSVVWNLDGWTWEDFTVKEPAGLHVNWPSLVPVSSWPEKSEEEQKKEREKALKDLREAFENAAAYMKARDAMAAGGPRHETDVRWEAMMPALRGEMTTFVHADEYRQIESALDFAGEFGLKPVLVGGRDAWRLADRLAAENVPVVLENVLRLPRRTWEPYDAAYTVAAKLHEAGVRFCISTGARYYIVANLRNLPYEAAMAAAFGLPKDEALKAVTLYPARILGVDDRLGSIEPGKDATLIVTDGDPLEIRTHVLDAWIQGRAVDLSSRHTRLYEKYRNRPRGDGGSSRLEPSRH